MVRTQHRPAGDGCQVPLLLALEPTRTAGVIGRLRRVLHDNLTGCCEGLAGRRSGAYLRQQLRGERRITEEDLAGWATSPTREARDAARAFALELLAATEPTVAESVLAATAAFARESADVAPCALDAAADGEIDDAERARLAREVHESARAGQVLLGLLSKGARA